MMKEQQRAILRICATIESSVQFFRAFFEETKPLAKILFGLLCLSVCLFAEVACPKVRRRCDQPKKLNEKTYRKNTGKIGKGGIFLKKFVKYGKRAGHF